MAAIPTDIHEQELFDIAQGLIRVNSENPLTTEEKAAIYVRDVLSLHGIHAAFSWAAPGRPNVIVRLSGRKPGRTLLYSGHLDVVPAGEGWSVDPFAAVIVGDRLIGRGAADMKSGVAAMMYAAIVLKRRGLEAGELILHFSVGEERGMFGMQQFLADQISADFAIVGEPTNLDVCIGHRGTCRYRVNVSGTPGHAAFVADPDNAIYNMARLLPGLEQLGLAIKKRSHPILGNASLTVTQIRGGTAPNIIPGFCEIEIDRRVLPGETRETMLEEFEQYVSNLAGDQALTYSIDNYSFVPASLIDPDHPFVHHTSDAAARILQKPSEIKAFKATCEAPFFSLYRGIPTLICGPGSLEQAHVIDEYVELREVVEAAALYVELAESLLHE